MYLLSRDGFMLVVMGGFTGAKARALPLSISPSLFSVKNHVPTSIFCP